MPNDSRLRAIDNAWLRRLHRWLVRLWRGAVAWVVQREDSDEH